MDTVSKDAPITEAVGEIQRLYTVKDEAEVLAFLQDHPSLVPLLLEAAPQLQKYFPGARLSVERIADPEEPIEQLFVSAATGRPVKQPPDNPPRFIRGWGWRNGIERRARSCSARGSQC